MLRLEKPGVAHASCPEFNLQTFYICEVQKLHLDSNFFKIYFTTSLWQNKSDFSVAHPADFNSRNKDKHRNKRQH